MTVPTLAAMRPLGGGSRDVAGLTGPTTEPTTSSTASLPRRGLLCPVSNAREVSGDLLTLPGCKAYAQRRTPHQAQVRPTLFGNSYTPTAFFPAAATTSSVAPSDCLHVQRRPSTTASRSVVSGDGAHAQQRQHPAAPRPATASASLAALHRPSPSFTVPSPPFTILHCSSTTASNSVAPSDCLHVQRHQHPERRAQRLPSRLMTSNDVLPQLHPAVSCLATAPMPSNVSIQQRRAQRLPPRVTTPNDVRIQQRRAQRLCPYSTASFRDCIQQCPAQRLRPRPATSFCIYLQQLRPGPTTFSVSTSSGAVLSDCPRPTMVLTLMYNTQPMYIHYSNKAFSFKYCVY